MKFPVYKLLAVGPTLFALDLGTDTHVSYLHLNCPWSENLQSIKSLSAVDSICVFFWGKV